jgi:pimeloyl-ACP methyl ester carboxylesterase
VLAVKDGQHRAHDIRCDLLRVRCSRNAPLDARLTPHPRLCDRAADGLRDDLSPLPHRTDPSGTPQPARHNSDRLAPIHVIRRGTGPEVLFVHGGASPETTWSGLEHLSRRWTLMFAYRRGFTPSPEPPSGRQDFELDAADICELLDTRRHLVGHSYGGVAAAMAAISRPANVSSLTLLEPALFLPTDDPEVNRFGRMGDEVLTHGLETDPATLREFLRIAGAPIPDDGPLPPEVERGVRRAHGGRSPTEARPRLELLRDAGLPSLVASGDHHPAIERMCDATATALGAQRLICPGTGHFVAAAPGFADQFERFLRSAAS